MQCVVICIQNIQQVHKVNKELLFGRWLHKLLNCISAAWEHQQQLKIMKSSFSNFTEKCRKTKERQRERRRVRDYVMVGLNMSGSVALCFLIMLSVILTLALSLSPVTVLFS